MINLTNEPSISQLDNEPIRQLVNQTISQLAN